jgi:hypothetical protein
LAALGNSTGCTVFVAKNVAKIMVLRCLEYQKGWEILGNSIRIALQGHLWQAEAGITRIRSQRNLDRKGRRLIGRLMNFPKKNRYEIHLEICDFGRVIIEVAFLERVKVAICGHIYIDLGWWFGTFFILETINFLLKLQCCNVNSHDARLVQFV